MVLIVVCHEFLTTVALLVSGSFLPARYLLLVTPHCLPARVSFNHLQNWRFVVLKLFLLHFDQKLERIDLPEFLDSSLDASLKKVVQSQLMLDWDFLSKQLVFKPHTNLVHRHVLLDILAVVLQADYFSSDLVAVLVSVRDYVGLDLGFTSN